MHPLILSGVFSSDGIEEAIGRIHLSENSCVIHLWERGPGTNRHQWSRWGQPKSLQGVVENDAWVAFLNLTPLPSSINITMASMRLSLDAGIMLAGREDCDPVEHVFSRISFTTTDTDRIFYAKSYQGQSLDVIQESPYSWEDNGRRVSVMQSSHRHLLTSVEMGDTPKKSRVVIQFTSPKPLWEAVGEMEKVSDFLSVISGKAQFCRDVRVYDDSDGNGGWDVYLGYVRPRPNQTSVNKVKSGILLIDPYTEATKFGRVLGKWLRGDDDLSTRRARHLVLQGWGSPFHDVDRLVRAATAYETQLSNQQRLSDTIRKHIAKYAEFIQALGLDTDRIADEAACSRHYHVHGRHPLGDRKCQEYDLANHRTLITAASGLEFLFLVPSLLSCGWDAIWLGRWQNRNSSHPFSIYLQLMLPDFAVCRPAEEEAFIGKLSEALSLSESS